MRGRHRKRSLVFPGVLAAAGAIAIGVALAAQQDPPQPALSAAGSLEPPLVASASYLPPSPPIAIDIPAIGVHSELQYVGLTANHEMQVPVPGPYYNDAAWYKYSSTPGSPGSAVIVGHVDSATDGPSVFFNLGDLRPGDTILVTRADGRDALFIVDGVRSYPKDLLPKQYIFGATGHPTLRLITCGGAFDRVSGAYLDNIVVFASLAVSG